MKGPFRMLALLVAVGVVAGASIAIAAPRGNSADKSSSSGSPGIRSTIERGHRVEARADLSALANELGVTTAELRTALNSVRSQLEPPSEPPTEPPSRADMEKRCTDLTDALAEKLNKSGDDVRAAIKKVAESRIDAAVKAGKLDADDAAQMKKDIESSSCMPFLGGHPGPHGCGGPGGFHHRGGPPAWDRNENRGSGSSGTSTGVSFTTAI